MIDRTALLRDLQREQTGLENDLRARLVELPNLDASLRAEHAAATARGRTASSLLEFIEEQLTQAAAAWLLGCVFVRFCEDNGLVGPVWLAGPGDRRLEAADAHAAYFADHPERNDRDWLLEAFRYLRAQPATAGLFDEHNPLWRFEISADAAERLVGFWRRQGGIGLLHDFADPAADTRFLGDLYQDLSEAARKRYALLQTPDFVADFILSRTLDRAIEDRGLDGLMLIDPTCGSGHFLLDAFHRLLDARHRAYPGQDVRERVQAALDVLHGVDLNPYAVAIARFRLIVAALRASGVPRLERAPAFRLHLATGDSLLHGTDQLDLGYGVEFDADAALSGFTYAAEDLDALRALLRPGQYDVVVGNPPYVTVKDKALSAAYRDLYETCHRQYALTVPFCQRFFELAKTGDQAGWVGQIASNSFMKREFGTKLIRQFLARMDLQEVIDTSGAYIPGHGTPTVILVGRHRQPVASTVRGVLGVRGEPSTPEEPAKGLVWRSIVENVDQPGVGSPFVTVADLPRPTLTSHPWSLSGGGAGDVMQMLQNRSAVLGRRMHEIGYGAVTRENDAYMLGAAALRRHHVPKAQQLPLVVGDRVRDWSLQAASALWPYAADLTAEASEATDRLLWPHRRLLSERVAYGQSQIQRGLQWYEYSMLFKERYRRPLSIAFSFVATHNHFVFDRGGKVFIQSAPVIKLPEGAGEDEHLRFLGLLNSSIACFWLKQVSHDKGIRGEAGGFTSEDWERFFEFTGTKLEQFPIPAHFPLGFARRLDSLAQSLAVVTPAAAAERGVPTRAALDAAYESWRAVRAEMISVQEELDWEVYQLYGLLEDDVTYKRDDLPGLALGERAFEIVLARKVAAGKETTAWFTRHGSTPINEVPTPWPVAYREVVERRIRLIEERPDLALIERPECKRRWAVTPWADQERTALRGWLLDRLESPELWSDPQGRPQPQSVAQLADRLAGDGDFAQALGLLAGTPDYSLGAQLIVLVKDEAVPHVAAARYTESGLRKRAQWEETWGLQRREDAGEHRDTIPVPPKYSDKDFTSKAIWAARGKLDVPKERFVLFTGAERDTDPTPVLGWAGWDHLQQSLALAGLVNDRVSREGWAADRLAPLLAGVVEREPWLHQWHAAPDAAYGGSPAAFVSAWLDRQLAAAGRTRADVLEWRPVRSTRGRRRRVS